MKKKILSILLSLAMVVTMIPMMTGVAFAGTITVGDVLNTVAGDFPVYQGGVPENAWTADNGNKAYIGDGGNVLNFCTPGGSTFTYPQLTSEVTKPDGNYVCVTSHANFTFNMKDDALVSIKVDALKDFVQKYEGTYVPPAPVTHDLTVTKNDGSEATEGVDYEWDSTDSNKLIILQDGLKVSGTTSKENIVVSNTVSNITLSDLNISTDKEEVDNFAVENIGRVESITTPLTITIDKSVVLANQCIIEDHEGYVLELNAATTIIGNGSLLISDIGNTPIYATDGIELGGSVDYTVVSEEETCFQYGTSDDEGKVAPTSIPIKISTTGTTSLSAKITPILLLSYEDYHCDFEVTENAGDVLLMTTSNDLSLGAITTQVGEDCADCTINLNNKNIFGTVNINETKENVKDQIEYKLNSDFSMSSYYVDGNLDTPARTILVAEFEPITPTPAPTPDNTDKGVKTGDSSDIFFYGFTTLLALLGAGFVYGLRRKEEK